MPEKTSESPGSGIRATDLRCNYLRALLGIAGQSPEAHLDGRRRPAGMQADRLLHSGGFV